MKLGDVEGAHWWYAVRRGIVLDALTATGLDPRDILEVGCGTGGFLDVLAKRYPAATVAGVEPSDAARRVALDAGRPVKPGAFGSLGVEDGSVDLLVALDVLEHCDDEDEALEDAMRVLRPGGGLVMTVPAMPSLWGSHDRANAHRCRYTRAHLTEVVGGAGFEALRCSYFNMFLLPLAFAARALPEAIGREGSDGIDVPPAPVNAALRTVFGLERPLLRHLDLPLGVSLVVTAKRPRAL